MARKLFFLLKATTNAGKVTLTFFKGTPHFESPGGKEAVPVVRVYRLKADDFQWGADYNEFFDGLDSTAAALVHEGPLPLVNHRKVEFVDSTVTLGSTYAYWVASDQGDPPTGPVAVRLRDPQVWWPHEEVNARLEALARQWPQRVALRVFGETVMGRPIRGLIAGRSDNAAAAVGVIHAGESGPELMIPAVEQILRERPDLLDRVGLAILPSANIDERERLVHGYASYLRTNSRGVDLNRNFPVDWDTVECGYGLVSTDPESMTYRGPAPASEPETRAVMAFLREVQPKVVFSFHHLASICGTAFLAGKPASADARDYEERCRRVVADYTRAFFGGEDRKLTFLFGTTVGGLATWAGREFNIPAFDLEWPTDEADQESKLAPRDGTTPQLVRRFAEGHARGLAAVLESLGRK
jgi:hypothetical protein